jgi:uncharacterized protein YjbJ (UPF0337 family)
VNADNFSLRSGYVGFTPVVLESAIALGVIAPCIPSKLKRCVMNQDTIRGHWKELAPNIKQHWGKLTEDDLQVKDGSMEYLTGKVEKRYGISHAEAEKQVREFENQISKRTQH